MYCYCFLVWNIIYDRVTRWSNTTTVSNSRIVRYFTPVKASMYFGELEMTNLPYLAYVDDTWIWVFDMSSLYTLKYQLSILWRLNFQGDRYTLKNAWRSKLIVSPSITCWTIIWWIFNWSSCNSFTVVSGFCRLRKLYLKFMLLWGVLDSSNDQILIIKI